MGLRARSEALTYPNDLICRCSLELFDLVPEHLDLSSISEGHPNTQSRPTTSSPTSPWTTISSSPVGVLLTLAPVANLLAIIFAAFLRSTPNSSRPWIWVACFRFVRSDRLIVIWSCQQTQLPQDTLPHLCSLVDVSMLDR